MRVTFYGVRGSVPAPGPATARYGGNTSCVEVRLADGTLLVLDAGTGMRALGNHLLKQQNLGLVHLLLSHTHWDHVLGLPFFGPLWRKETEVRVHPVVSEAQERFLRNIFDDIHFPVRVSDIPAKVDWARPQSDDWRVGSARVSRIPLNHPGGSQGLRIDDADGTSVAYLTDNELSPPNVSLSTLEDIARFADGVDLLIHDSQYTHADMPLKRGWGHSIIDEVLRLGAIAEPRTLALYHHDPDRTDDDLDAIGVRGADWMASEGKATQVVVASEGAEFELTR